MRPDTPATVAFLWHSKSLTGAQRRFLAIARALNMRGQRAIVVLEERDARVLAPLLGAYEIPIVSFKLPFWLDVFARGRRMRKLWWHSGFRQIYHLALRKCLEQLRLRENIGLWHIAMTTDLAHCTSGPTLFEVTSPDWADRLATEYKIVPAHIPLHAVSPSVGRRLRANLVDASIIEAPLLFPSLDSSTVPAPKWEEKENLIVFAHRLIPRKNGLLFAKVARSFLARHPNWQIVIRGEGPEEPAIRDLVATEITQGTVVVGYTSDLASELRRSKIFVSIISPDNYPSQSVVEAMIYGNALLLSDMGQSRERFIKNNGMTTQIDEASVFDALDQMVDEPDKLSQMGLQSSRIAAERFSQEAYLMHLLEVYRNCGFNPQ